MPDIIGFAIGYVIIGFALLAIKQTRPLGKAMLAPIEWILGNLFKGFDSAGNAAGSFIFRWATYLVGPPVVAAFAFKFLLLRGTADTSSSDTSLMSLIGGLMAVWIGGHIVYWIFLKK